MKEEVKRGFLKFIFFVLIVFSLFRMIKRKGTDSEGEFYNTRGPIMIQRLVFTDFHQGRQGKSYEVDETEDINKFCALFETGRRTDIDSTSDLPHKDRVTVVQFFTSPDSGGRITLYREDGKEYLDEPFEKLYELPKGSWTEIRNMYLKRGRIIEQNDLK